MTSDQTDLTLGVDVGGTKIAVIVMTKSGEIVNRFRKPTEVEGGPDRIVEDIATCIDEQFSDEMGSVRSVGLGIAGLVERKKGTVFFAPNLNLKNTPLGPMLEDRIDRPVLLMNDVDAATYGEWKHGVARDLQDVVGVFLGTGVGGGVITGGRLLEGQRSSAAELGHMPVVEGGRTCSCGNQGCLEAYAGGWAIAQRARERVESEPERGDVLVEIAGSREDITAETVSRALSRNDELAREVIEHTEDVLNSWASGMVNVFNPDCIVVGGSVGKGFPRFRSAMEEYVNTYSFEALLDTFDVREAELDDSAVAVGAGAMAYREQT